FDDRADLAPALLLGEQVFVQVKEGPVEVSAPPRHRGAFLGFDVVRAAPTARDRGRPQCDPGTAGEPAEVGDRGVDCQSRGPPPAAGRPRPERCLPVPVFPCRAPGPRVTFYYWLVNIRTNDRTRHDRTDHHGPAQDPRARR